MSNTTFFDIEAERRNAFGSNGAYWNLIESPIGLRNEGRMGIWSANVFVDTMDYYLAGAIKEAHVMLMKHENWFEIALRDRQIVSYPEHEHLEYANWYYLLAMCKWLLRNEIDEESLGKACEHIRAHDNEKVQEVAPYLPFFIAVHRYQDVMDMFKQPGGLKPPSIDSPVKCRGKMSYLIASHFVTGNPKREALLATFNKFLRYFIPDSLYVHSGLGWPDSFPILMLIATRLMDPEPLPAVDAMKRIFQYIRTEPPPEKKKHVKSN